MKHDTKLSLNALLLAAALPLGARAADVTGTATWTGPAPKKVEIKMEADPKCAAMHGGAPVYAEEEVVDAAGHAANVFVYVKKGLEGKKFDPPAAAAQLDQKGCAYVPRVQGLVAGQPLEINNTDETLHNVRGLTKINRPFNFGQPTPGTRKAEFKKPEKAVKIKCDVHPWMTAYVFAMEHPYFAVSAADGTFTIKDLPAGDYTLAAWHEKWGELEAKVTVGGDGAKAVDFKFAPR